MAGVVHCRGFETVSAYNISLLIQQREAACRRTI